MRARNDGTTGETAARNDGMTGKTVAMHATEIETTICGLRFVRRCVWRFLRRR
jgi:hypothetical protein